LKGVEWRRLNEKLKRYALVEAEVKKIARERGVSPSELDSFVEKVMTRLRSLRLKRLPSQPLDSWV